MIDIQANRAEWLAALRSGNYAKIRGCYTGEMTEEGQCACSLGVWLIESNSEFTEGFWKVIESELGLPNPERQRIARRNDCEREYAGQPDLTLPQMADWIEANILKEQK